MPLGDDASAQNYRRKTDTDLLADRELSRDRIMITAMVVLVLLTLAVMLLIVK